jgi:cobalt/nickel transport system permease protein
MHISEGVLSGPVLFSGAALAAAGTAVGLKKIDYDRISQVGILSAAFFVASLVHVNVGPSSVHLILNGLLGIILGWAAFPAILVALALQALFFQFGGITVLGINVLNHALPALICYYAFNPLLNRSSHIAMLAAFACGFLSIFLTAVMVGLSLIYTQANFWETASLVITAHIPVMVIEGIITAFCIGFLKRVHPVLIPAFSES